MAEYVSKKVGQNVVEMCQIMWKESRTECGK